jgi:hypothetical protein
MCTNSERYALEKVMLGGTSKRSRIWGQRKSFIPEDRKVMENIKKDIKQPSGSACHLFRLQLCIYKVRNLD